MAVDHYHRFREDVALMAELGLTAYRFSVAWPRITPHVTADALGPVNAAGLAFYSELVDALLAAGIEPSVTLYHWDLPQALEDAGGWTNRATAERFAEYAAVVAEALGDRVGRFITAERAVVLGLPRLRQRRARAGRAPTTSPRSPPCTTSTWRTGCAVAAIRAAAPTARVGLALNLAWVRPATDSAADADAARRVDGLQNRVFLDPILDGRYPADVLADTAAVTDWSFVRAGDLAAIAAPIDLLGVNYYTPTLVRHWTRERPRRERRRPRRQRRPALGRPATTSSSRPARRPAHRDGLDGGSARASPPC